MIRSNLPVLSNRFSANWTGDRWAQNSWVPDSRSPVPSWAKGPSCPCPDWPRSNFFDILHIAYCRMSQNTHFVCYFVRLKMTSVVFFSLFSSLPSFDGRTLSIYALNAIMSNKIRMVRQFCTRAMLLYTWICVWRSCIPDGVWISTSNYVEITESTERVRFNEAFKIRSMPTFPKWRPLHRVWKVTCEAFAGCDGNLWELWEVICQNLVKIRRCVCESHTF